MLHVSVPVRNVGAPEVFPSEIVPVSVYPELLSNIISTYPAMHNTLHALIVEIRMRIYILPYDI